VPTSCRSRQLVNYSAYKQQQKTLNGHGKELEKIRSGKKTSMRSDDQTKKKSNAEAEPWKVERGKTIVRNK
jgi:hypothetical protein